MNNAELNEKIINILTDLFDEKSVDMNVIDDDIAKNNVNKLINNEEIIDSNMLGFSDFELNEFFVIKYVKKEESLEKQLEDYLQNNILMDSDIKNLNFIFFVNSMEKKIRVKKLISTSLKKNVLLRAKKEKASLKKENISYRVERIPNYIDNVIDYSISIDSRMKCIEINNQMKKNIDDKTEEFIEFDGTVFSANLFDIVKIYNSLDNELFSKNVRYSIGEELQVEKEIKNTLSECPDKFWYLNNGITVVLQNQKIDRRSHKSIKITYDFENQKLFSVINGAQTISTSADFFYDGDVDIQKCKLAQEKAKVLLKIINIQSKKGESVINPIVGEEIDQVSIALNRQKPIKPEDVAYTMPFVSTINELRNENEDNEDNIYYFNITKRGENTIGNYNYDLVQFGKMVLAYKQKPGEARAKGRTEILAKKDRDDQKFKLGIVFEDEITNKEDARKIFLKNYKPTNLAFRMEMIYVKYFKQSKKNGAYASLNEMEKVLYSNGKMFFIAYIVLILNNRNVNDFTEFKVDITKMNENEITELIDSFIKVFVKVLKSKDISSLSSNDFKNQIYYDKFIKYKEDQKDPSTYKEYNLLEVETRKCFVR